MAPNQEQVLEICRILSEQEQIEVTLKEAGKGFLMAGAGAALGTLIAGPLGMFIGGSAGSAIAACRSYGKCKSLVNVIKYDMTSAQQAKLAASVTKALESFSTEDILILLPMVLGSDSLKSVALREIVKFVTTEMGLAIVNNNVLQN